MIDYEVLYIDKEGDKQDYVITSTDVRTAMNNTCSSCALIANALLAVNLNQCLTTNVQNTSRNGG